MGKPWEHKRNFGEGFSNFGTDTNGHDVKGFGDTTGKYFMWDASADTFNVSGILNATEFKIDGVAGADHGPADITSITVVKGIVTAVTSV